MRFVGWAIRESGWMKTDARTRRIIGSMRASVREVREPFRRASIVIAYTPWMACETLL